MKEERILALDQSTTATGWALIAKDKGKVILEDHGIYEPNGTREERIHKTRLWLEDKLNSLSEQFKVTLIIEEIQMQNNVETFKSLAHLQGVLIDSAFLLKNKDKIDNWKTYYATAWKSTCDIKGKRRVEQKKNAQLYVKNRFNIEAREDACDAICIGVHHLEKDVEELNFE